MPYLTVAQIGSAAFQTFNDCRGYVRWDLSDHNFFAIKILFNKIV